MPLLFQPREARIWMEQSLNQASYQRGCIKTEAGFHLLLQAYIISTELKGGSIVWESHLPWPRKEYTKLSQYPEGSAINQTSRIAADYSQTVYQAKCFFYARTRRKLGGYSPKYITVHMVARKLTSAMIPGI